MSVAFIKPVVVGDTLTVHGVRQEPRARKASSTRVTVEVWCENQDGVKTMVGTASGLESDLKQHEPRRTRRTQGIRPCKRRIDPESTFL